MSIESARIGDVGKRIFLWAVPRSTSTAFFRAMMNSKDIKVLLEPYARAYYFGSERVSKRYADQPVEEGCTYADMKTYCERECSGSQTIFIKDMAYYLVNRLDDLTYIPDGFTHTILIRNPRKSVTSLYKMSMNDTLTGWNYFDAAEIGFKELWELHELISSRTGQSPLVIDADDLLSNPEMLLREYCSKVGIKYEDSMVNWDQTPPDMSIFNEWLPWFEGTLKTTAFRTTPIPPKRSDMMKGGIFTLPNEVERSIAENQPYYDKLYKNRLTHPTLSSSA